MSWNKSILLKISSIILFTSLSSFAHENKGASSAALDARNAVKVWYESNLEPWLNNLFSAMNNSSESSTNLHSPAVPALLYYESCTETGDKNSQNFDVTRVVAKFLSQELGQAVNTESLWGHIRANFCEQNIPITIDALKSSLQKSQY